MPELIQLQSLRVSDDCKRTCSHKVLEKCRVIIPAIRDFNPSRLQMEDSPLQRADSSIGWFKTQNILFGGSSWDSISCWKIYRTLSHHCKETNRQWIFKAYTFLICERRGDKSLIQFSTEVDTKLKTKGASRSRCSSSRFQCIGEDFIISRFIHMHHPLYSLSAVKRNFSQLRSQSFGFSDWVNIIFCCREE
jgi:hypothetical protein